MRLGLAFSKDESGTCLLVRERDRVECAELASSPRLPPSMGSAESFFAGDCRRELDLVGPLAEQSESLPQSGPLSASMVSGECFPGERRLALDLVRVTCRLTKFCFS